MILNIVELIVSLVVLAFCFGVQVALYKEATSLWKFGKFREESGSLLFIFFITSLVAMIMLYRVATTLVELFN